MNYAGDLMPSCSRGIAHRSLAFLGRTFGLGHRAVIAKTVPQEEVNRAVFMTGGGYRMLASANFGGLVLACIDADLCVQILVFQVFDRFSRSTIVSHSCAAPK